MAAQIPAGLLVDRFGARAMLVVSGTLLAAGQLLLAFATGLPLGRARPGARRRWATPSCSSAVLALVPRWFPAPAGAAGHPADRRSSASSARSSPRCRSLALLHAAGWSAAFGTAAAASALVAVLVLAVVRNAPGGALEPGPRCRRGRSAGQLRAVWLRPGTRLGFFGHMGTQFSMMVFALLWGVPYLVSAQGLSPADRGRADHPVRRLHDR